MIVSLAGNPLKDNPPIQPHGEDYEYHGRPYRQLDCSNQDTRSGPRWLSILAVVKKDEVCPTGFRVESHKGRHITGYRDK